MKVCRTCKVSKELSEFYPDKSKSHGYRYCCKDCAKTKAVKFKESKGTDYSKNVRLKGTYGITLEDYNKMFEVQEGRCGICNIHQLELGRSLNIDHDHSNGQIRMLLCTKCNTGLGSFEDSPELLEKAISYLLSFKKEHSL